MGKLDRDETSSMGPEAESLLPDILPLQQGGRNVDNLRLTVLLLAEEGLELLHTRSYPRSTGHCCGRMYNRLVYAPAINVGLHATTATHGVKLNSSI